MRLVRSSWPSHDLSFRRSGTGDVPGGTVGRSKVAVKLVGAMILASGVT